MARKAGVKTASRFAEKVYSRQYMEAVRKSDLLIHPPIPALGMAPGRVGMRTLIKSGQAEAEKALAEWRSVGSP